MEYSTRLSDSSGIVPEIVVFSLSKLGKKQEWVEGKEGSFTFRLFRVLLGVRFQS